MLYLLNFKSQIMKTVKLSSLFDGDKFKFFNYDNREYTILSMNGTYCNIFNEETKYISIPQAYLCKLDVCVNRKPLTASDIYKFEQEEKNERREILKSKIDDICRFQEISDVINVLSLKISKIS